MLFLSNAYFAWLMDTYSVLITIVLPGVIIFGLKLIAIFNPNVPTNKILDLIQSSWPTKDVRAP